MNSWFREAPGAGYGFTRDSGPAFGRPLKLLGMGQAATTPAPSGDTADVFQGLVKDISDLIKDLPADSLGVYKTRLTSCQNLLGDGTDLVKLGVASECLRVLYEDIKKQRATLPAVVAPAPFPYVPVAIAAAGVIGLIAVLIFVKKK